jgi:hypothetical protein
LGYVYVDFDFPDEVPTQTPHVPPLLQWAHLEQLEHAVQFDFPVHFPPFTFLMLLQQLFLSSPFSIRLIGLELLSSTLKL